MKVWNDWYHVNGHTYGTRLPGDPRGWRSKRHKKHVDGDYRNLPPAGTDRELHQYAKEQMKQPPVRLSSEESKLAGQAMVEKLFLMNLEPLVVGVGSIHYHLLARFRDYQVRKNVAYVKSRATFRLQASGRSGTIWAKKCSVVPVTSRQHQLNVYDYIVRHRDEGAWVWTFRDGVYWDSELE